MKTAKPVPLVTVLVSGADLDGLLFLPLGYAFLQSLSLTLRQDCTT